MLRFVDQNLLHKYEGVAALDDTMLVARHAKNTQKLIRSLEKLKTMCADLTQSIQSLEIQTREKMMFFIEQLEERINKMIEFLNTENSVPLNRQNQRLYHICCYSGFDASQIATKIEITTPDAKVYVDANEIGRVVMNLLVNAQEATRKISIPEIVLKAEQQTDFTIIQVSDNGKGIPKEKIGRIFDSGFTTKEAPGHGFGLAICKEIVEVHGGTIAVDSIVLVGTTFTITLPNKPTTTQPTERKHSETNVQQEAVV